MAITYSAGAGTTVTTSAKNGTVKSFTGGKVRLQDPIGTANNGNLMASPTYVSRLIYISGGTGVGQTRFITGQTTGLGDGDDVDLDVSEPWETNPDGTSTYELSYIVEDCATLAGLAYVTRSGFWEWKRRCTINGSGTFAWLFLAGDKTTEWYDNSSTTVGSMNVASNGRLDSGYDQAGASVFGNANVGTNAVAGELALGVSSGGFTRLYDFALYCTVQNNLISHAGTSIWAKGKTQTCSYVTLLGGTMTISGWTFSGAGTTNDTIRIEDTITINSMVMEGMYGFESLDDTLTETLEVRNCAFVNSAGRSIRVHDDKTWNMVNPVGLAGNSTEISFEVDDLNEVNKLFSLAITVTEPDGTEIVDADCYVYEGLLNQDLPTANRVDTDSNGVASTDVLVEKYTFPSSVFTTTTSGDHALKVYEWLKTPFVTALVPDFTVTGGLSVGVTLIADPNIVQTTQATAITAGSGITIERPTNPTTLLSYDTGTIAFAVGNTVTGLSSGATGIVTEVTEGDTTSGRIHLRARNSTAFTAGEQLQVSAVTNAQATNPLVALDYSTHIDCNALSLQTVYDYWAARQAEDTIGADGITSLEWGEGEHAQIVFADGGGAFRTERNVGLTDGVFLSDRGAGSITYMTNDGGTQYTPPTSVTLSVTVLDSSGTPVATAQVAIYDSSNVQLMNEDTNGSGIATEPYNYTSPEAVTWRVRKTSPGTTRYLPNDGSGTITAAGFSTTVTLNVDSIAAS